VTDGINEALTAIEASRRLLKVQIIAQIGHETYELGSGMVGEAEPLRECADLLRGIADQLEREAP
jgi:hypothetical protein